MLGKTISYVQVAIMFAWWSRRPVMLWGAPGLAKTARARQFAKRIVTPDGSQAGFCCIIGASRTPTDLQGVPTIKVVNRDGEEQTITVWSLPDFLPTSGYGVILIDDLSAAPPLVQVALLQLLLDRELGSWTCPEGWRIIAAGNRQSDRAGAGRLNRAMDSRFAIHVDVQPNADEFLDWGCGLVTGDDPIMVPDRVVDPDDPPLRIEVTSYLSGSPDSVHRFNPDDVEHAYPCYRTWEYASELLDATDAGIVPEEHLRQALIDCIGQAEGKTFHGFREQCLTMPDADEVIADPQAAKVPEGHILYALCGAIAARAEGCKPEIASGIIGYARRIVAAGRRELAAFLIISSARRAQPRDGSDNPFKLNSAYGQWVVENPDLV